MNKKKLKKEIRLWRGRAYERLLNKALRALDKDFGEWRDGKINPFELSERIHKFHNGISRSLYVSAGSNDEMLLLQAIDEGEINTNELRPELWEQLRPQVEFFKKIREETPNEVVGEENDR